MKNYYGNLSNSEQKWQHFGLRGCEQPSEFVFRTDEKEPNSNSMKDPQKPLILG